MAYFIIIRGALGIGKSTISRMLAEKINAEVVHFDNVMDELGLDYIPGDKWIPLDKFLKADKIMMPKFRQKLESGNSLILDGNFYHKKQVEDLISKLEFRHFVFTLKADLQECIKRDKGRKRVLGEDAAREVYELVNAFDCGINIDTNNKTSDEVVNEIIARIGDS